MWVAQRRSRLLTSGDAANSPFSIGDAATRRGDWGLAFYAFPIALRRRVAVGSWVSRMGRGWSPRRRGQFAISHRRRSGAAGGLGLGFLLIPNRAASPRRCWKLGLADGAWLVPTATRPIRHFPSATQRRGGGTGAWLSTHSQSRCVAASLLEVGSRGWGVAGPHGDAANSPFPIGDAAARRGDWGLAFCSFPTALRRRVAVGSWVSRMGRGWSPRRRGQFAIFHRRRSDAAGGLGPGFLRIPNRAASPRRCWKLGLADGAWLVPTATRPIRHFPSATQRRGGGTGAWLFAHSQPRCVAASLLEVGSRGWGVRSTRGSAGLPRDMINLHDTIPA